MAALFLLALSSSFLLASALPRSLEASMPDPAKDDDWDCSKSVWDERRTQEEETCPPAVRIPGCNCRERGDEAESPGLPTGLRILCFGTVVTLDDFINLRGKWISSMEITSCTDSSVPDGWFVGLKVFQLKLDGTCSNIISKWRYSSDGGPLTGLENSLQELILYNHDDKENSRIVPSQVKLSHLRSLRRLSFFHWFIRDIKKDFFQIRPPGCLRDLRIRWSRVERIHEGAFKNLTHLQRLQLDDNRMSGFNRTALDDVVENLVEFSLENNDNLQSLPETMFSGMPSLRMVYLNRNYLRSLPEVTWSPIWEQLHTLDLSRNQLECDSSMEWMRLKKYPQRFLAACSTDVKKFNHDKDYTVKAAVEDMHHQ